MNSQQRKYLVDTITSKVNAKIKNLKSLKETPPSLQSYVMHLVLSDNFEILSNEFLKNLIKEKALKGITSARPEAFLSDGNNWSDSYGKNKVVFNVDEFFILPKEYEDILNKSKLKNQEIEKEVSLLSSQMEGLVTRIMLASDNTLQKMINEVDDMGDLSLIDMKIKLLN